MCLRKLIIVSLWFAPTLLLGQDTSIQHGAQAYNQNCTRCHNARPAQEFSDREWSVIIPHMREKAHLTGKEAKAMLLFLQVSNGDQSPQQAAASSPLSGAELVAKYGCLGCHKMDRQGGTIGPKLDGVIVRKGEEFVKKKLSNPRFDNPSSAMPKYPFSNDEIQILVAFLKKKQPQ